MACMIGNYDFQFVEGDTYSGFAIRFTTKESDTDPEQPIDLTGATIQLRISSTDKTRRMYKDLTTYNDRITITNPTDGRAIINKQKIKLPANLYEYSLQIKFKNGDQKTYLAGNCTVLDNTTKNLY